MHIYLRKAHDQHLGSGVVFAILASISFTLMSLTTKFIGHRASTDMVVCIRFFISLILILPWVIKHPKDALTVTEPIKLIIRTLFSLLAIASFFYVLKFISLTESLLLNNTSPLFIPFLVWITHQTKTSYKIWIGVIVGFIGITFVLKPGVLLLQSASLIGLASGLFTAIAYVMIRTLTKTLPIIQILFYNFLICFCVSAVFLPFTWQPISLNVFGLLLIVGVLGLFYQFFSTLSIAKAPVRITSSLQLLSIVFGTLADFLVWKKIPDLLSAAGIFLVILGGIITIYFGQKELRQKK